MFAVSAFFVSSVAGVAFAGVAVATTPNFISSKFVSYTLAFAWLVIPAIDESDVAATKVITAFALLFIINPSPLKS